MSRQIARGNSFMAVIPSDNANIRLEGAEDENTNDIIGDSQVEIIETDEDADVPEFDVNGNTLKIEHADGAITLSLDGKPIEEGSKQKKELKWFDNIVESIDDAELSRIGEDLLRGIADDKSSRQEWIEDRAYGMRLLGLRVEQPGNQGPADGAPIEGMSKFRHPLMLEAVLRFQANARSEMLPTDGPVKVRDDSTEGTADRNQLADDLETDMNHYLTSTAVEYYPDTDRMFLMLGFGGCAFKKVYRCPLRNRPVSETVDAEDLIVNNAAVSLETAKRVTHKISMKKSTLTRMQIIGAYRDIDLSPPKAPETNAVDDERANQQGISLDAQNPEDRDYEIYEVYCELDIQGFEHTWKGKKSGLEIPYIVTIETTSRQVLSVVRNYNKSTEELPEARKTFVKYQFVPGFGFYDIGLVHILGNTTTAVTAMNREGIDAGMFAVFPGFLYSDGMSRQDTTQFRVPPGGGARVNTNGMKISEAIMPLPYKEPGPAFLGMIEALVTTGQRVGGTSELQVGEGKADAPVGTTLALIEQATKIQNSVHKRMHTSQAQEFELIKECFKQYPESFWKANRRPATKWDQDKFLQAVNDYDLVPQADPNTSSHSQRLMKLMGLKQLSSASPELYDKEKVDSAILVGMGYSQPDQFFKPKDERDQMPPEMIKGMSDMENDTKRADADMLRGQAAMIKAGQSPDGGPTEDKSAEQQIKLATLEQKKRADDQKFKLAQMAHQAKQEDTQAKFRLENERNEYDRMDDDMQMRHQREMEHEKMNFERESDVMQMNHERAMETVKLAAQMKMHKDQGKNAARKSG